MANTSKKLPNKLIIDTGVKRIDIIRNGENVGVFTFNPTDYVEAQKHANIITELEQQQKEYAAKAAELDKNGTDKEKIDFFVDFLGGFLEKIDDVYGDGTSDMLFGGALDIDAILSFFKQLQPFYAEASEQRKAKALKK